MASIYGSVLAVFFPLKLKRSLLQSTACSSDGLCQKLAFLLQVVKNVSFDTDALTQLVMITVKQVSSQSDSLYEISSWIGMVWDLLWWRAEHNSKAVDLLVRLRSHPHLWSRALRFKECLGSSLARG